MVSLPKTREQRSPFTDFKLHRVETFQMTQYLLTRKSAKLTTDDLSHTWWWMMMSNSTSARARSGQIRSSGHTQILQDKHTHTHSITATFKGSLNVIISVHSINYTYCDISCCSLSTELKHSAIRLGTTIF